MKSMRGVRGFVIGLLSGCMLMLAMPTMAATVKQFVLGEAPYPIEVNGSTYESDQLPVMNYKGSTYVPLRAVGDLLGGTVGWDSAQRRVIITYGGGGPIQNNAFRNVQIAGSAGKYTVTGEGRVFEAMMSYAVEDGHNYLLEKNYMLSEGAPAWSAFKLDLLIPANKLPKNGTLMLQLFEYSAKDGSKVNILNIPLETFEE
ncbi:Gmad2 immunoglobulin-like domain-containing protein [Paenibacillus sp. OV219]|uniref:Gmad2 immunoglobulin-like domain-containing protein n=1 Tax=Paenibacillus sp. OV219 TaxID=1884377 RepID=UPI0008B71CE8|nr:Gmad2 immunoglobulin-like domain-containing protein [Paenibacillus sp. OV219]SEO03581.1 Copper amine oxidase N-terminal domain-containing protein [Paenibacillus sp. OV219]